MPSNVGGVPSDFVFFNPIFNWKLNGYVRFLDLRDFAAVLHDFVQRVARFGGVQHQHDVIHKVEVKPRRIGIFRESERHVVLPNTFIP